MKIGALNHTSLNHLLMKNHIMSENHGKLNSLNRQDESPVIAQTMGLGR